MRTACARASQRKRERKREKVVSCVCNDDDARGKRMRVRSYARCAWRLQIFDALNKSIVDDRECHVLSAVCWKFRIFHFARTPMSTSAWACRARERKRKLMATFIQRIWRGHRVRISTAESERQIERARGDDEGAACESGLRSGAVFSSEMWILSP